MPEDNESSATGLRSEEFTGEFPPRGNEDTDLEASLVDATGHADSGIADLVDFMDPGRSRFNRRWR